MRRIVIALLLVLVLLASSCRTARDLPETMAQEQASATPGTQEQWSRPGVSAGTLTDEEWERMFPQKETAGERQETEEAEESSTAEDTDVVAQDVAQDIPEMTVPVLPEEEPEPAEITEEPDQPFVLEDEPMIEISFDIGSDEVPEIDTPPEIVLAGEEEPSWSWLEMSEPDYGIDPVTEVVTVEPEKIEDSGWVEDVNPDIVSAIASDYNSLHDGISAKPALLDRVKDFVTENLLWIYAGIGVMILVIVIVMAIRSAKKKSSMAQEREEDEGEEIVTDFGPRPDAQYYRSPLADPSDDRNGEKTAPEPQTGAEEPSGEEEETSDETYDDGF